MSNTLYAAFADAAMAEKAAGALLDHGVRAEDLSLVSNEARHNMPGTVYEDTGTTPMTSDRIMDDDADMVDAGEAMDNTARSRSLNDMDEDKTEMAAKHGISTTTGADAGSGAITGTAVGLGVGAIAALAALLVPGVGLVVGGGALAAALGGMAATAGAGAATGAVVGYLKDQGVDDQVATQYGEAVTGGGAVLSVHVPSGDVDEAQAQQLLSKYGAMNVNTYAMSGPRHYVA